MNNAEFPYLVGVEGFSARDSKGMAEAKAGQCPHPVWVTRILGGEPLSVSICQLCGDVNWKQLREDFKEAAALDYMSFLKNTLTGAFASEDRSVVNWQGQNYIKQPDPAKDTEECPEDAARRYARQLLELQEGLKERGVNLDNICEDHLVKVALECWDEAIDVIKRIGSRPSNA